MPSLSSASALQVASEVITKIIAQSLNEVSAPAAIQQVLTGGETVLTTKEVKLLQDSQFIEKLNEILSTIGQNVNAQSNAAQANAAQDGVIDVQELNEILATRDARQELIDIVNEALAN